jgi:integrase
MAVLSAALGRAVEEGLIPFNPSAGVRALPAFAVRPRALTVREVEDLRAAMTSDRDRLIVSLIAYAGLRPAEVVGLPWANVTAASVIVDRSAQYGKLVPTKTRRVRAVPIEKPVREDLDRAHKGANGELVAPGDRGGLLVWRNFVRRQWAAAALRAGVKAVPYDLRHTFATLLIYAGRPIPSVAAALGHASPSMTLDTYAHAVEDAGNRGFVDFAAVALDERGKRDAVLAPDLDRGDSARADMPANGDRMDADKLGGSLNGEVTVRHGTP